MDRIFRVLGLILMSGVRKAIEIVRHPQTKIILKRGFKQAVSLLKVKPIRGIALLYLAGLFSQMGLLDLSVGACLLLLIDNADLVLSVLGHGSRKRRYY